jgi:hypothetical protein
MVSTDSLSPLQRTILVLAYDNWEREGRTTRSDGCDCYYYEILVRVWRFENRWAGASRERTPTYWHFGRRQMPYARYNAALASLSRSVKRLTAARPGDPPPGPELAGNVGGGEADRCGRARGGAFVGSLAGATIPDTAPDEEGREIDAAARTHGPGTLARRGE